MQKIKLQKPSFSLTEKVWSFRCVTTCNDIKYLYSSPNLKIKMTGFRLQGLTAIAVACMFFVGLLSCQSVKQYQKMHLNDAEMKLGARKIQKTEQNFQIYREGASGANGGKSGGGCGCN